MVKATMKIVKNDGVQTLLAGLGPTTWGYLFEGAVKFGIYEVLKPAVRQMLVWLATVTSIASLNNKVLGFVICGGFSGVAASLMLCPMEALRIRLVSEPDFDRGGGWVNGFLRMLKYEGVGGLWKGINAMMLKQGKSRILLFLVKSKVLPHSINILVFYSHNIFLCAHFFYSPLYNHKECVI